MLLPLVRVAFFFFFGYADCGMLKYFNVLKFQQVNFLAAGTYLSRQAFSFLKLQWSCECRKMFSSNGDNDKNAIINSPAHRQGSPFVSQVL